MGGSHLIIYSGAGYVKQADIEAMASSTKDVFIKPSVHELGGLVDDIILHTCQGKYSVAFTKGMS